MKETRIDSLDSSSITINDTKNTYISYRKVVLLVFWE